MTVSSEQLHEAYRTLTDLEAQIRDLRVAVQRSIEQFVPLDDVVDLTDG